MLGGGGVSLRRYARCERCDLRWPVAENEYFVCPNDPEHFAADLVPLGRWGLIRLALEQRARYNEEWGAGWWFRPGGWEFGPFLARLWPYAVALKCAVCVLLNRRGAGDSYLEDVIEVAIWEGESHGSFDGTYHSWRYLSVRKGWRPSSWRFGSGVEST